MVRATGAILAGGRGTRMGLPLPKQDVLLPDGRSMIQATAEALGAVCQRVVIVGHAAGLADLPRLADVRPASNAGPLAGIEALLRSGMDTHYLVVACDMPRLTPKVLRVLLAEGAAEASTALVTALHVEGQAEPQPLPMLIRGAALPVVSHLLDGEDRAMRGLHQLMKRVTVRAMAAPASWAAMIRSVNTMDDLDELRRQWSDAR